MRLTIRRVILLVPVVLHLTACAPIVSLFGMGSPAAQIASQIDQVTLLAGGVVYVGSGKTISDHVLSNVTGDDCKITNIVSGAPFCVVQPSENTSGPSTSSDHTGAERNF